MVCWNASSLLELSRYLDCHATWTVTLRYLDCHATLLGLSRYATWTVTLLCIVYKVSDSLYSLLTGHDHLRSLCSPWGW